MELKLTRPICFFDLETTGMNVAHDRIVEISILKVYPNGNKESKTWLVNPEMQIPEVVIAIHGISNEKVANEPTFNMLSKEIYNMIKDSDLGGFNSDRFDIPLLAEEMLRANIDFDMKNMVSVDVQTIFHKMEKRTLGAACLAGRQRGMEWTEIGVPGFQDYRALHKTQGRSLRVCQPRT